VKFAKVGAVRTLLVAACAIACWAAPIEDQQFNGRWDITVNGLSSPRGWWLEVSGAGANALKGKFVGAPIGQVDEIPKLSISDGELRFAIETRFRQNRAEKGLYWARFEDGKLKGTFEIEGDPTSYLEWTGTRAPLLPEKDEASWKKGDPVVLFDGHDLTGWQTVGSVRTLGWTVKDGILTNGLGTTNFVSEKKFWNFALDVEYRIGPHTNSGIGLRGRYEIQIADDADKPVTNHSSGGIMGRIAPALNASKMPGDWQTMSIRLVGRQVTVLLNGIRVLDKQNIDGPTAIAMDTSEADPGPILLQGDRGSVAFRKIIVYPLSRRP
jgi:3-keto-disaccharide hydrolase